jgi:6-phosphogluconate dehydrogenase
MKLAMVGLGRMGSGMVRRLLKGGHECVVFDRSPAPIADLVKAGAQGAQSLADLVKKLEAPRVVWIMVPAGEPTDATVTELRGLLEPGDIIVDGGNSYYKDDIRRSAECAKKNIFYIDAGTSGGVWGFERGFCLMVGGEKKAFQVIEPALKTLAPGEGTIEKTPGREKRPTTAEKGYLHCGGSGSGHFVKMIHNGIEYGMMQAFAEGFDIMKQTDFKLELAEIAELWRRGSVVTSWLLDLTSQALAESPQLDKYKGYVQDSGEGRWTVQASIEHAVPAPVLTAALFERFRSRVESSFADKMLSAMREKFGGHKESK